MALTPDDIAHRAFSPSVDGYHQGEVRTYLERIASQLRALKAVQTEGIEPLADLHVRLERYEPQLAHLEQGLGSVLAELQSTAAGLAATQAAQRQAMAQLADAQRLATDQLDAATALITEQRAAAERVVAKAPTPLAPVDNGQSGPSADQLQLAADQQAANERAAAQRAATEAQLATAQRAAAEEAVALAAALKAAEAARDAAEKQAAADKAIAEAQDAARRAAEAAPAANVSLTTIDLPKEMQTPPPLTLDLDIDTSPRISENAHELLDGVLDDVLQDLNDEGPSSS